MCKRSDGGDSCSEIDEIRACEVVYNLQERLQCA